MKNERKRIYFLLSVFLLLVAQAAVHECQDIFKIEHIFSSPVFERLHPEDLALIKGDNFQELKLFIANASAFLNLQKEDGFIQISHKLFPTASPDKQTLVLRC
jgi:hypothetical protein